MVLDGVVLLAASTARSQAYIQALVAHDLHPELVLALGEEQELEPVVPRGPGVWEGVTLPDLAESVSSSCGRARIPINRCPVSDVNAPEVLALIAAAAPRMVIYSGFGGQIVSERVLGLGSQFLHLHSGWLPDYRGSTTLYYALLNGDLPGVTALILDRTIDTGPVVARKRYPRPPFGMDLDRVYDAAIRADLLVQVMQSYCTIGSLPTIEVQSQTEGVAYYVIHPVLKHMALLSLAHGVLP